MNSFIELPRLSYQGRPRPSVYINTADIIMVEADYSGQTNVLVREMGSQGTGIIQTYVPLVALLDELGRLAERPGVRSWAEASKSFWADPQAVILAQAAERERGA